MQIQDTEREVLHVLTSSGCDRGDSMSITRLVFVIEDSTGQRRAGVTAALRRLKRRELVSFRDGDAVRVTETGIAALASL